MYIDPTTGRLDEATYIPSPNHDERANPTDIGLLVIHGISLPPGEFGGPYISALFTNQLDPQVHEYFQGIAALHVSAHLLIRRDGSLIQYVPFHLRAWHAGKSCYAGRDGCNDFSIGIELEGTDDQPYEPAQYTQLGAVTRALMQAYPGITRDRIAGHCDVAPGRKTDPGPYFDWAYYFSLLA
ncbi:MAG: 1,6-anhydro-N-acetylmuramyl-L-alanine amidase AmpD [Gammaproteobacteria bacterium]|nr:1,6-anhydro-N-acetylmuramyl-L-alanine amidase AmpD [Gammaproteobacteria bacterium]